MKALPVAFALCVLGAPALAAEAAAGARTVLDLPGDAQITTSTYTCDGKDAPPPFSVQYVNAAPNFLAILPVDGKTLVFSSVLSADGARYAAGPYVWWTRGATASLADLRKGKDAEPISCVEASDSP